MRVERLDQYHERHSFSCGTDQLDAWFHEHALIAQRQDTARTFVLVEEGGRVMGYYSLAMGSVARGGAPARLVRGTPRHAVPMVLLARLAIDETAQGEALGTGLLFEALQRAALAAEHAAARLIAVDPIDDRARTFYLRWGFRPIEDEPGGRLFIRTRDVLASFPADYGE